MDIVTPHYYLQLNNIGSLRILVLWRRYGDIDIEKLSMSILNLY